MLPNMHVCLERHKWPSAFIVCTIDLQTSVHAESLADQQDAEGFKQHLPAAVQLFQQQFEVADSCFIKNAHQLAHAGHLQHDSVDKQQYLANIWEVNGFRMITDAVMTVLAEVSKAKDQQA